MKKLILIIPMLFLVLFANAQKKKVKERDLDGVWKMVIKIDKEEVADELDDEDNIFAKFRFTTPVQESSRLLLSKAVFFRNLFLSRRTQPRMSCNLPVETCDDKETRMGVLVNISYGGAGFLSSKRYLGTIFYKFCHKRRHT